MGISSGLPYPYLSKIAAPDGQVDRTDYDVNKDIYNSSISLIAQGLY